MSHRAPSRAPAMSRRTTSVSRSVPALMSWSFVNSPSLWEIPSIRTPRESRVLQQGDAGCGRSRGRGVGVAHDHVLSVCGWGAGTRPRQAQGRWSGGGPFLAPDHDEGCRARSNRRTSSFSSVSAARGRGTASGRTVREGPADRVRTSSGRPITTGPGRAGPTAPGHVDALGDDAGGGGGGVQHDDPAPTEARSGAGRGRDRALLHWHHRCHRVGGLCRRLPGDTSRIGVTITPR